MGSSLSRTSESEDIPEPWTNLPEVPGRLSSNPMLRTLSGRLASSPWLFGGVLVLLVLLLSMRTSFFGRSLVLGATLAVVGLLYGVGVRRLPASPPTSSTEDVFSSLSSMPQAQREALESLKRLVLEAEAYDRSMNSALGSVYDMDQNL